MGIFVLLPILIVNEIKKFLLKYAGAGASAPAGVQGEQSWWGLGVRVSSGHLCEAEAPTEPAGETQRPNYQ